MKRTGWVWACCPCGQQGHLTNQGLDKSHRDRPSPEELDEEMGTVRPRARQNQKGAQKVDHLKKHCPFNEKWAKKRVSRNQAKSGTDQGDGPMRTVAESDLPHQ